MRGRVSGRILTRPLTGLGSPGTPRRTARLSIISQALIGRASVAEDHSMEEVQNPNRWLFREDGEVAPYSNNYFQNDSSHRVTEEIAAGAGSSDASNPGHGTFTYSYSASSNARGKNSGAMKTTVGLPDGNSDIVYTNEDGEVMRFDYHAVTGTITAVNISAIGHPSGIPSGWGTPSGGG